MKKSLLIMLIIVIIVLGIIFVTMRYTKFNKNEQKEETFPYILDEGSEILERDIKKGMTIKDSMGNEWVWIVVPKEKVFKTAKDETDYLNIKKDIKEYTDNYTSEEYEDTNVSEETLSSIYKYGGFWISRYEIGSEKLRNDEEDEITQEPLSQPDKYVYNNVTFYQAKELATKISNGKYNSNLLYGFQWDLVCKFIEENGYTLEGEKMSEEMINSNSSSWGNYYSSTFQLNRGKYSSNYGEEYKDVSQGEIKKAYRTVLFTTGASEYCKVCNIYDFAGNVSEWTLESLISDNNWNIIRDGSFYFNYGGNDPVNGRYNLTPDSKGNSYGFRVCAIKSK